MTTTAAPSRTELLDRLLALHRPGFALPASFHTDPEIFRLELDRIWRRSWLFAGHACQAASAGDYFTFEVGPDSLVIIRDEDGVLRALRNSCRHRGTRVCAEGSAGSVKRLVCPYHQWSYGLDGELKACGGMDRQGQLDRRDYGLRRAHLQEVGGLIFVFLGEDPPAFAPARTALAPGLEPQGLDRARVAATRRYDVKANWKLVWENNRECWHCQVGHPEYIQANFDAALRGDRRARAAAEARGSELSERLREQGLEIDYREPGLIPFPAPGRWWSINRTPLVEGFVTESLDGRPVAPLMGDYTTPEVGTLRVRGMPNFWNHSSGDYAMSTRLAPASSGVTRVDVQWLVHEDAVEGRDYDLERLLAFWQITSEQDWVLCESNQIGVQDSAYLPGPYSTEREYNVIAFTEWYLEQVATPGA
jgi:Rieske 2Fe-2S family protein